MKKERDATHPKKAKGQAGFPPRRKVRALLKLFSRHESVLVLINPAPDAMQVRWLSGAYPGNTRVKPGLPISVKFGALKTRSIWVVVSSEV